VLHLRIKAAASLLAGALVAVMLSGCAFMPNDISELESAPKLTAEQQDIQNTLEAQEGNKLTLEYPLEGDYRGAFVLTDNAGEALAFYSNGHGPYIAVLDRQDGKWKVVQSIVSQGSEIDSIQFGDFNGDGSYDFAVGWRSAGVLSLCVYLKSGATYKTVKLSTYTKLVEMDITGDGKTDIVALNLDPAPAKARARLFSDRGGQFEEISNSPLDSTVTKYSGIYATSTARGGKNNVILIDGFKGSNQMVTEILYYKNGRLRSPLYNAKTTKTVTLTMRGGDNYKCYDIDGDGQLEIPLLQKLPTELDKKKDNQQWIANWCDFTGGTLRHKVRAVMNYTEEYFYRFPASWGDRITVDPSSGETAWKFCRWDASKNAYESPLFTIYVRKQSDFTGLSAKANEQMLARKGGLVYTVQIAAKAKSDALALTSADIRKNFSLLR
jgi:hypothetical protein